MVYPRPAHDLSTSPTSLETILEHVQLDYLSKRSGGLQTTRDWQDELSLGEQQVYPATVVVAPLMYNRCLAGCASIAYVGVSVVSSVSRARRI